MRIPSKVYDWIFFASMALIAAWMILKVAGVINSPTWQELLPFAGALFGAGAFYQKMRQMGYDVNSIKGKITHMDSDIGHLRIDVEVLKSDVSHLKSDVSYLKSDVSHFKTDMSAVKRKLAL